MARCYSKRTGARSGAQGGQAAGGRRSRRRFVVLAAALFGLPLIGGAGPAPDPRIAGRVMRLTRETVWTPAGATRLPFRTFHPQGMVRIGVDFYISSVEVRTPPARLSPPVDGHDRSPGAGVGHLFRVGPDGALKADLLLGEGDAYHAGGIDFDGRFLWIPVAEYRPNSRAVLYRVDPMAMTAKPVLRVADHIGALAFDRDASTLHGVSWGSRQFYSWKVGPDGALKPTAAGPTPNPEHYIDYQDCHGVGAHRMLCSGLSTYRTGPDAPALRLGGLDLIDLKSRRPVWQVPVELWSPTGRPMTQNPAFVEATERGLRAWFLPDDDESTLFAFDVDFKSSAAVRPTRRVPGASTAPPRR